MEMLLRFPSLHFMLYIQIKLLHYNVLITDGIIVYDQSDVVKYCLNMSKLVYNKILPCTEFVSPVEKTTIQLYLLRQKAI